MKIAIITDTHFGARGDKPVLSRHMERFYREVFFPHIDQLGIDTVLHLGDLGDNNRKISYTTKELMDRVILRPMIDRKMTLHIILGNHDRPFKNTNRPNLFSTVFAEYSYPGFHFYDDEPTTLNFPGCSILMCPWISPENRTNILKAIKKCEADVLAGHFEITGFDMGNGRLCDKGMNPKMFAGYPLVLSGHFHKPSSRDNIMYLGAPYEMNRGDIDMERGFYVFDTESKEIELIKNPNPVFVDVDYNDLDLRIEDLGTTDFSELADCVVTVRADRSKDDSLFDAFVEKMELFAFSVDIVEPDAVHVNSEDGTRAVDVKDTPVIIRECIRDTETDFDKDELADMMLDIYNEALAEQQ